MSEKKTRSVRSGKQSTGRKQQAILTDKSPFAYAEAYKTLRTNLEFITAANEARCIVLTSALPEESKSTTAVNLALTLAEGNRSVILVECDLRKPVMRKYLKLGKGIQGLTAVLSGSAALEDCVIHDQERGISVLCAGTVPPNPSELLSHNRMQTLIEYLKEKYDYVLLDAPPVTLVTDAAVLGRMADGALLVIRSKYAQAKAVRLAKQRLDSVGVKILGAILTRFDMKKSGWRSGYDYEGYDYGYGRTEKK